MIDVIYPGLKVELSFDMSSAHATSAVKTFIQEKVDKGWLVIGYIPGGITSVIQVCDLVANKDLKQFIKQGSYKWRTEFIQVTCENLNLPQGQNDRITLKMPLVDMAEIVEGAIKKFNTEQQGSRTIEAAFQKSGQDPWFNCDDVFKSHLDSLESNSLYKQTV